MAIHSLFAVVSFLSIFGLLTVAMTIYSKKALREHPSPLIANICIAEAIMSWATLFQALDYTNYESYYLICYLPLIN